ncbi:MAG: hypothetical protein M3Y64_03220 [Gemmatimonadota bacterium]|nr:hypothetical protein [Gemmatimonadota bacterium]
MPDAGNAGARGHGDDTPPDTVGELSTLYLGNILYAIERCAFALDEENKPAEAAFYRGIGRKLAEAYGRTKREQEL